EIGIDRLQLLDECRSRQPISSLPLLICNALLRAQERRPGVLALSRVERDLPSLLNRLLFLVTPLKRLVSNEHLPVLPFALTHLTWSQLDQGGFECPYKTARRRQSAFHTQTVGGPAENDGQERNDKPTWDVHINSIPSNIGLWEQYPHRCWRRS